MFSAFQCALTVILMAISFIIHNFHLLFFSKNAFEADEYNGQLLPGSNNRLKMVKILFIRTKGPFMKSVESRR